MEFAIKGEKKTKINKNKIKTRTINKYLRPSLLKLKKIEMIKTRNLTRTKYLYFSHIILEFLYTKHDIFFKNRLKQVKENILQRI